jgi:hypothetical protein
MPKRVRLRVERAGYTRKAHKRKGFTVVRDSKRIRIPPTTVKITKVPLTAFKIRDIGAVGRGKRVIKKIRKGLLKQLGYTTKKSDAERQTALRRAYRKYGGVKLFKMLQAQVVLRKRTQPKARAVFVEDRNWVEANLMTSAEKVSMTAPARKAWVGMTPTERAIAMPDDAI